MSILPDIRGRNKAPLVGAEKQINEQDFVAELCQRNKQLDLIKVIHLGKVK